MNGVVMKRAHEKAGSDQSIDAGRFPDVQSVSAAGLEMHRKNMVRQIYERLRRMLRKAKVRPMPREADAAGGAVRRRRRAAPAKRPDLPEEAAVPGGVHRRRCAMQAQEPPRPAAQEANASPRRRRPANRAAQGASKPAQSSEGTTVARMKKRSQAKAAFQRIAQQARKKAEAVGAQLRSSGPKKRLVRGIQRQRPRRAGVTIAYRAKRIPARKALEDVVGLARRKAAAVRAHLRKRRAQKRVVWGIQKLPQSSAPASGMRRRKGRTARQFVWKVEDQLLAGEQAEYANGRGGRRFDWKRCFRPGQRLAWGALAAVCFLVFCVSCVNLAGYALDYLNMRRASDALREAYYAEKAGETGRTPLPEQTASANGQLLPASTDAFAPEADAAVQTAPDASPAPQAQSAPTPSPTPQVMLAPVRYPDNPFAEISSRFAKIRRQNSDIVGWLTLEDLIDEAVVQRDNTYYLNRDYRGYHNVNGAIFLEQTCDLSTRPYTLMLYGHNMKTGAMFGSLRNYENFHYYKSNAFITFDTAYEDGRYVIFSVCTVSTETSDKHYLDFAKLCSNQIKWRQEEIEALEQYSIYHTSLSVEADDQLLLLITCVDEDTERRVIAARRIRQDETEGMLQRSINNAAKK